MAKMYHALVLMSGGLAGCASSNSTDDVATQSADGANPTGPNDEGTNDPTPSTTSSAESTSANSEPSPAGAGPTEADSSGDDPTPSAPDSSTDATNSTATDPNANGNETPTEPDSSGDDPTPPEEPDPGIIIVSDPAPSVGTLLDDCPLEQQQCEVRSCFSGSAGVCGDTEFCSLQPEGSCSCDPERSLDCAEDEVLTCLLGRFPAGDAGMTEQRFDCRCLPLEDDCKALCAQVESAGGGQQRTCVEQDGVVLCGGCILAGILR